MSLEQFANKITHFVGTTLAFLSACAIILIWAGVGPLAHYSDTWQLVINTSTTIVTFLMVFLIQRSQNKENHVLQAKLNELIRANARARNQSMNLENLSEEEVEDFQKKQILAGQLETTEGAESAKRAQKEVSAAPDPSPANGKAVVEKLIRGEA